MIRNHSRKRFARGSLLQDDMTSLLAGDVKAFFLKRSNQIFCRNDRKLGHLKRYVEGGNKRRFFREIDFGRVCVLKIKLDRLFQVRFCFFDRFALACDVELWTKGYKPSSFSLNDHRYPMFRHVFSPTL